MELLQKLMGISPVLFINYWLHTFMELSQVSIMIFQALMMDISTDWYSIISWLYRIISRHKDRIISTAYGHVSRVMDENISRAIARIVSRLNFLHVKTDNGSLPRNNSLFENVHSLFMILNLRYYAHLFKYVWIVSI